MKIESFKYPSSSFLSIEKDLGILVELILKNNRLKKMIYYTTPDCLNQKNLSQDQSLELFGKNVKIVPKLKVDQDVLNYVFINFNGFTKNPTNPQFRDNILEIDVVCHYDQWLLRDFQLRPYKIAAEIDSMLNQRKLTGIGKIEFIGADKIMLNDEFGGVCLLYGVVHGEEDKKFMPNPMDEEEFIENFNEMFNEE